MEHLFHVSDQPNISRFEPHVPPSKNAFVEDSVVWAIGESLLHNYLFPRDRNVECKVCKSSAEFRVRSALHNV